MVENFDFQKKLEETKVNFLQDEKIKLTGKVLGQGSFGNVYQGIYEDKPVAVKELMFSSSDYSTEDIIKDIINEIKAFTITEKLHPAIVHFYGVWLRDNKICFVFEQILGQDLNLVYKSFSDKRKLEIILTVCEILGVLHKAKLIHRDIKPNNIMIEDESGKVRIIDFGTVKIAKNETTFTVNQKGTDVYMCPELIEIIELDEDEENDLCHFSVSPKVDVWAIGCVISEVFSGFIPWENKIGKNAASVRKQLKKKAAFPIPEVISNPEIVDIIKACTEVDVEKRITIFELHDRVKALLGKM